VFPAATQRRPRRRARRRIPVGHGREGTLDLVDLAEDLAGVLQEHLAAGRRTRELRPAQQERHADLLLEGAHLLADGGLAHAEPDPRTRERAELDDGPKDQELRGLEAALGADGDRRAA
jgi:hypothetical protein